MENEVNVWNNVMAAAIKLPLVNVNRDSFLRTELSRFYENETVEKAIELGTKGVIPEKIIDNLANGCIKYHLTTVTATAALAGIPGGWAMLASVPADIAQFYGNALALMQKLLYLYGYPSITNDKNEIDDETMNTMTLFMGVMLGSVAAQNVAKEIFAKLGQEAGKRIPRMALTKTAWYPILRQVMKWIGIKLTRDLTGKTLAKVVPLIGAPVNGGMTYFTFRPMAYRLKKQLKEQYIFNVNANKTAE